MLVKSICQTKGLQGDLEYLAQGYGLEVPQLRTPCAFCAANASDLPWTDARASAQWRGHCFKHLDHASWLALHPTACQVFHVSGVTNATVKADTMHCKYLGVDANLSGSFLAYLCHYKLPGSVEANMGVVWESIQRIYQETCSRVRKQRSFPKTLGS